MMDYKEQSQQIELKTAGLDVSTHVSDHCSVTGLFEQVCISRLTFNGYLHRGTIYFGQQICVLSSKHLSLLRHTSKPSLECKSVVRIKFSLGG